VDFKRTSENQARKKLRKNLDTLLTPIGQPKSFGGRPTFWRTTWRSTQKFRRAANFSVDDLVADRKVSAGSQLFGCPLGVSKVSENFRNFLRAWFSEVLLKSTFGHHFFSLFKHLKINFLLKILKKFFSNFFKTE